MGVRRSTQAALRSAPRTRAIFWWGNWGSCYARGLAGARIGIPRAVFYDEARHRAVIADAIAALKEQGATIIDPADIPNQPLRPVCSGSGNGKGSDEGCSVVFKYGMKRDFNKWLASLGPAAPVKTLTELRQWNLAHAKAGAMRFGQSR